MGRDKFADIHLQAFADWRQIGEVGFFQVLAKAQPAGVGAVDHVHGLAKTKRNVVPGPAVIGVGLLISDQLHQVQAELIRRKVESTKHVVS